MNIPEEDLSFEEESDLVMLEDNEGLVAAQLQSSSIMIMVCVAPLVLQDSEGRPYWTHPRPGSALFCKPVILVFEKESGIW